VPISSSNRRCPSVVVVVRVALAGHGADGSVVGHQQLLLAGGDDRAGDLARPIDGRLGASPAAQRDGVAVLEPGTRVEPSSRVMGVRRRSGSPRSGCPPAGRRARDGAGGEQVAGAHVGAVGGQVGELLGEGPVQVGEAGPADHSAVRVRPGEVEVEAPVAPGARRWSATGGSCTGGSPGTGGRRAVTHPAIDVAKLLPSERPERLVLEGLDVARRPVVDEAQPKRCCSASSGVEIGLAHGDGGPDDGADLELDVEAFVGPYRFPSTRRRPWGRAMSVPSDDRAGPAVVPDRHVAPVGQAAPRRRGGTAGRGSWRGARGVEVDVVAGHHGERTSQVLDRHRRRTGRRCRPPHRARRPSRWWPRASSGWRSWASATCRGRHRPPQVDGDVTGPGGEVRRAAPGPLTMP
jgi:hypothetical protein